MLRSLEDLELIMKIKQYEDERLSRCSQCNRQINLDTDKEIYKSIMERHRWICPVCGKENYCLGWEYHDVSNSHLPVMALLRLGLIKVVYKSNSATCYMLDRDKARWILADSEAESKDKSKSESSATTPIELDFSNIIGYDDIKAMLKKVINSNERVHVLFIGPPASAKTLFLMALRNLPNSILISGTSTTKAGLIDLLFNEDIRFLLIDEIGRLSAKDADVLYMLMENGMITETKYGRNRSKKFDDIKVFATANTTKGIAAPLLSRFLVLHFEPYKEEEFYRIGRHMLKDMSKDDIDKILPILWHRLEIRDVRIFYKINGLYKSNMNIDEIINIISKYGGERFFLQ